MKTDILRLVRIDPAAMLSLYRHGAFPMGDADGKLYLVSPDPRAIIPLDGFHVSKSLARKVRARRFLVTFDQSFPEIVDACADRPVTWITPELREAYLELFRRGRAHSVEAWSEGRLAGGAYGLSIGAAFFAESMFHRLTDAGMAALATLVSRLRERRYELLDVQFLTPHLARCGATEISRAEYLKKLGPALRKPRAW